jgi:hypothetical protein
VKHALAPGTIYVATAGIHEAPISINSHMLIERLPRAQRYGPSEIAIMRTSIDTLVFRFAGVFVLVSLALAYYHSSNWLWLTAFVGANLVQASFTGFCPLAILFRRLGVPGVFGEKAG